MLLKIALILICFTNPWKLEYSKNGVSAYTRKVANTKYLEYKIDVTTKGKLDDALEILTDLDLYGTLYPYLKSYELLSSKNNFEEFDVLLNIKTPFPVKNRIGVYNNKVKLINDKEAVISILQKSDLIPEDTKLVKIVDCYGSWRLKQLDPDTLHISQQFFADPGGSIPAWIINEFVLKHPLKTVKILAKLLSEDSN